MKPLVWALYLMLQPPGAGEAAEGYAGQSLAFTGVTYLNREACRGDAATFTKDAHEGENGRHRDRSERRLCLRAPAEAGTILSGTRLRLSLQMCFGPRSVTDRRCRPRGIWPKQRKGNSGGEQGPNRGKQQGGAIRSEKGLFQHREIRLSFLR